MTFKGKCISFLKKMSQKNFEDGVEFVRSFYNQVKLLCRLYFRNKLSCVFRADFFNLYAFYQLTCFNDFTQIFNKTFSAVLSPCTTAISCPEPHSSLISYYHSILQVARDFRRVLVQCSVESRDNREFTPGYSSFIQPSWQFPRMET